MVPSPMVPICKLLIFSCELSLSRSPKKLQNREPLKTGIHWILLMIWDHFNFLNMGWINDEYNDDSDDHNDVDEGMDMMILCYIYIYVYIEYIYIYCIVVQIFVVWKNWYTDQNLLTQPLVCMVCNLSNNVFATLIESMLQCNSIHYNGECYCHFKWHTHIDELTIHILVSEQ